MTHYQWTYLQATAFTREYWMWSLTLQQRAGNVFHSYLKTMSILVWLRIRRNNLLTNDLPNSCYLMNRHNHYFYIHMFCLHGNYYVFCHKDMREQLLQEFVLHIYHENNPRRRDLEFGFLGNLVETSLFPARYDSVSKITIH